jgi:acetyl esterase/lipase
MGRKGRNILVGALWIAIGCDGTPTSIDDETGGSTGVPDPEGSTSESMTPSTTDVSTTDASSSSGADSTGEETCSREIVRAVQYARTSAAEHLNQLDVWPLPSEGAAADPIVIFVHGGGWVEGDKATHEEFPNFAEFFADQGFALVVVNYRLVDDPDSPGTTYAEQTTDLAHAIAWVHEHAPEFCGDPSRIQLLGHSAGAHLVSLVAADGDDLADVDLSQDILSGVVALDVNAYDIPWSIEHGAEHDYPAAAVNLPRVFGNDLASQRDASPITHLSDAPLPPHLIVSAPIQTGGIVQSLSRAASELYVDALVERNTEATFYEAQGATHSSLVTQLGTPGDPVTAQLVTFFSDHSDSSTWPDPNGTPYLR